MPHGVEPLENITLKGIRLNDFDISIFRRRLIRVLVVVDGSIGYSDTAGFGVGRFVRLFRETAVGCTGFVVDVADRGAGSFTDHGPGGAGHLRYSGFRFDSKADDGPVLDRYHEVFLFGFVSGGMAEGA